MFFREGAGLLPVADRIFGAWGQRRANLHCDAASGDLVTEQLDRLGSGANPSQASVNNCTGEVRVLRQESVTGVDAVCSNFMRQGDQCRDVHVRLGSAIAGQAVGLVGNERVQRAGVSVGIDRDGSDAQVARRAGDADRDLPTVGNEHRFQGCLRCRSGHGS